jgi:hypothetical protein
MTVTVRTTAEPSMPRRPIAALLASAAIVCLAGAAGSMAHAAPGAAPGGTAVYWMTADTTSGMGAMAGGGASTGAMARAMMGGGSMPSYGHNLQLQLGIGRTAPGTPAAEHIPPAGLQAGPSLPLVSAVNKPAAPGTYDWKSMPKPKGRILIYWGCGDHARAGQPAVIDFATMTAGKMPPAFATIKTMTPPSASGYATYGEWPNARSQAHVPAGGSLVGEHLVKGNYTPDIKFTVARNQDFLAPVQISGNEAGAMGSVPLSWRPVAGARAWLVSTMGSAGNGDLILWSSSESQVLAMAMGNIAPGEIDRLVAAKVLLPASATRCTVPAEVAKAAESAMLMTTALGGEANFSYPARPAKAPAGWHPDWAVKLLTKSTYTGMLGMDMSEMFGGGSGGMAAGDDDDDRPRAPQPRKKRGPLGGLGGLGGLIGN